MRIPLFVCLALVLLNAAIYSQVRNFDFVNYDDGAHVYDNLPIKRGLSPDSVKWAFSSVLISNYIPVTTLSYLFDFHVSGLDPGAYHLTNLLFHTLNSLLLFLLMFRLTSALWPSAFVAALFAIHPLHVESVAWISSRKDVISTFFWFLALWVYASYVRKPRVLPYLSAIVLFALGLLAKPMLVTLPFVLLLIDYWPLNRFRKDTEAPNGTLRGHWGVLLEKAPFFVLTIAVSVLTFVAQRDADAVPGVGVFGTSTRIYNAIVSYGVYAGKSVWPSGLIPFYPHPGAGIPLLSVLLSVMLLTALTTLCVRLRHKRPYLIVGWLWFLGTLVPVIGIVQVGGQAMADRYTYVPLVGLFMMAAWAAKDIVAALPALRIPTAISGAAIVSVFSILSWQQARHWENSIALFEHTLRFSPRNSTALANLGEAYLSDGRSEEAIGPIEAALAQNPQDLGNLRNLASAYRLAGRYKDAEEQLTLALRLDPESPKTHNHMGLVFLDQGQDPRARLHFERALALDPGYFPAHINLGNVLLEQNLRLEALAHYRFVLRRYPQHPDALTNMGATLLILEDYEYAIPFLQQALKIVPDDAVTLLNLAVAFYELGRIEDARAEAQHALRSDPGYAKAEQFLQILQSQPQ